MKIFISTDIEGLSGIPSWQWWKDNLNTTREILLRHLIPIIKTIKEYDEQAEILIVDSHSKGENFSVFDLGDDCSNVYVINGFPRVDYMMSGIDESYDAVFFVGYHSMAGDKGAMDHTYSSSSIYSVKINGKEVGETTINSAFAGEFGVPVALVIGQRELSEEIKTYLPWAVHGIVQESVGRFAVKSYPYTMVYQTLVNSTRQALDNLLRGKVKPMKFASPINVEIHWLSTAIADVVSQMPIMERVSPRITRYVTDNWKDGFRWLLSAVYMSYLGQR